MTVEKKVGSKTIRLMKADITDIEVDAFVYDIMEDVKLGTGYGGAIMARGGKVVQDELDAIGACKKGEAIITSAGRMKSNKIIHVNGPKFHEPDQQGILKSVVISALNLAQENGVTELAFPPIGTGFYQVDINMCAKVMVETVADHLKGNDGAPNVCFVGLDTREYKPLHANIEKGA